MKEEPSFKLSSDFSSKVIQRLKVKRESSKVNPWIWGIVGIVTLAVTVVGAVFYLFGAEGFQTMATFIYWTFMVISVIGIVQLLDAKLVKRGSLSRLT